MTAKKKDVTEQVAKKVVGISTGAIIGGLVVAPVVIALSPLIGLGAIVALPIVGISALAGMWGGHKVTQDTDTPEDEG